MICKSFNPVYSHNVLFISVWLPVHVLPESIVISNDITTTLVHLSWDVLLLWTPLRPPCFHTGRKTWAGPQSGLQAAAREQLKMHNASLQLPAHHPSQALHSLGIKPYALTMGPKCPLITWSLPIILALSSINLPLAHHAVAIMIFFFKYTQSWSPQGLCTSSSLCLENSLPGYCSAHHSSII